MIALGPKEALMPATLTSARYAADDTNAAIELCFDKGWTDGPPCSTPQASRPISR